MSWDLVLESSLLQRRGELQWPARRERERERERREGGREEGRKGGRVYM